MRAAAREAETLRARVAELEAALVPLVLQAMDNGYLKGGRCSGYCERVTGQRFHSCNAMRALGWGEHFDSKEFALRAAGRTWDPTSHRVLFVMLNPSTADHKTDDPTIRRCVGFARRWGAGAMHVVNLFAFRATNPAEMLLADDPIGPHNDRHIQDAAVAAARIVCAWGATPTGGRAEAVLRALAWGPLFCLGRTVKRTPRHPLYVKADTPVVEFTP